MKILENILKTKPNVNIDYLAYNAYVDTYLSKKHDRKACLFYLAGKTDELVAFGQKYAILAPAAIANLLSLLPHKTPRIKKLENSVKS